MTDRDEAISALTEACEILLRDPLFVLIISSEDECFVQASPKSRRVGDFDNMDIIEMDLPLAGISDETTMDKALRFFRGRGGSGPVSIPVTFDGVNDHMSHSLILDCGPDAAVAANLIMDAFDAIHGVKPDYLVECFEADGLEEA